MTTEKLIAVMDILLGDVDEDREPRNIYLGRNQMILFQQACNDPFSGCVSQSSTSGIYRNNQVLLYGSDSEAVIVSTMPRGGFN